ncbi:MAG: aminoacyl-tRNA hydrolase [bacterium]
MSETYLLVGLGNPGRQYAKTRHNIGFMVLDNLARNLKSEFTYGTDDFEIAQTEIDGRNLILTKPSTFMNKSGEAVVCLVDQLKLPLHHLLVIVDDLNLPFGKLRIRSRGQDGGHNGLASVIDGLNSHEFPRLRIGIDDGIFTNAVSFVLSNFTGEEEASLPKIIECAEKASLTFVRKGVLTTMNIFN